MTTKSRAYILFLLLIPAIAFSFLIKPNVRNIATAPLKAQQTVQIDTTIDDEKVTKLFAWVSLAFAGEPEYNNLMMAIAAIFGNLPEDSEPVKMVEKARKLLPPEEKLVGDPLSVEDREHYSLGAMVNNFFYSF